MPKFNLLIPIADNGASSGASWLTTVSFFLFILLSSFTYRSFVIELTLVRTNESLLPCLGHELSSSTTTHDHNQTTTKQRQRRHEVAFLSHKTSNKTNNENATNASSSLSTDTTKQGVNANDITNGHYKTKSQRKESMATTKRRQQRSEVAFSSHKTSNETNIENATNVLSSSLTGDRHYDDDGHYESTETATR